MNRQATFAVCAAAAGLMTSTGAMAKNELVLLTRDEFLNHAEISIDGSSNRLVISQEHTGGIGLNTITATINGDLNGGPLGASFTGAARGPIFSPEC